MLTISKTENIGNTFDGLVMTAFNCKKQSDIKIDPFLQHGRCGTVEVKGESFDWYDRGDRVDFIAAE